MMDVELARRLTNRGNDPGLWIGQLDIARCGHKGLPSELIAEPVRFVSDLQKSGDHLLDLWIAFKGHVDTPRTFAMFGGSQPSGLVTLPSSR